MNDGIIPARPASYDKKVGRLTPADRFSLNIDALVGACIYDFRLQPKRQWLGLFFAIGGRWHTSCIIRWRGVPTPHPNSAPARSGWGFFLCGALSIPVAPFALQKEMAPALGSNRVAKEKKLGVEVMHCEPHLVAAGGALIDPNSCVASLREPLHTRNLLPLRTFRSD
jgi:hypothetical protein